MNAVAGHSHKSQQWLRLHVGDGFLSVHFVMSYCVVYFDFGTFLMIMTIVRLLER